MKFLAFFYRLKSPIAAMSGLAISVSTMAAIDIGTPTTVTAFVSPACLITINFSLDFGTLAISNTSPFTISQAQTSGLLSVSCTSNINYTLGVNTGLNSSSGQRRLRLGATSNFMLYNLYSNSSYITAFPASQSSTSTGGPSSTSVYAQIPAQTLNSGGTYTDTLTFTVNY
ncbi:MAG TPA: spore coat U domain-containing protein [Variovorax sp.]|nr:spore coat U domain-containing protein [Variovorax sp.]